jgi:uroporphyrinogen decarboxylase
MKPRDRFLKALNRETPDRLPVTTHHLMPYFLDRYLNGMSNDQFFAHFGIDPIRWFEPRTTHAGRGDFLESSAAQDPNRKPYVLNENWRIEKEDLKDPIYPTERIRIRTPAGR